MAKASTSIPRTELNAQGSRAHFVRIRDSQSRIALIKTHTLNMIRVAAKQSIRCPAFSSACGSGLT